MAADVAAAPALDPQAEEDDGEEEYEYVFVNLEDVYSGHQDLASASEIVIEGLLTDKPKVTVANITYAGEYDDDLGSTMYFDRASLQRVEQTHRREVSELSLTPHDEEPLVCMTSKRLRTFVPQ